MDERIQRHPDELVLTVPSQPPELSSAEAVDGALLALFRKALSDGAALPYMHQADAFARLCNGEEVALVAGTAAGKTLAVAIPLLHMLFQTGQMKKVVFVYPTRALLADQARVLRNVASVSGQGESTIGEVRGGMTSAALIEALGRPVVVATPDALYWFLRKNVKFSMALIYGVAQADALVLDEAHLYTGLMRRNMQHFLDRLRYYRQTYLGAPVYVHYLTATDEEGLKAFSPQAVLIPGNSKAADLTLRLRAVGRLERQTGLQQALSEALAAGNRRVLVVLNSARQAHALFLTEARRLGAPEARRDVPSWFWERFGVVQVGRAVDALRELDEGLASRMEREIRGAMPLRPRDLAHARVALRGEYLAELAGRAVDETLRELRRALWRYRRAHGEEVDRGAMGKLLHDLDVEQAAARLGIVLQRAATVEEALAAAEGKAAELVAGMQDALDRRESEAVAAGSAGIVVGGDVGPALDALLADSRLTVAQSRWLAAWMTARLTIDRDSVQRWEEIDWTVYSKRTVALRRVLGWIEGQEQREPAKARLVEEAAVEHRGVGVLSGLPGAPLAILYSGSMAHYAREGLIELFAAEAGRPVVLISTSAVEVGVDFAAEALITEACSLSSFLQRLGRVGRREGMAASAWAMVEPAGLAAIGERLGARKVLGRGDLAVLKADRAFEQRRYVEVSRYADALQLLVTQQLGRTGSTLAQTAPPDVRALAEQIQEAGIEVDYGLRGTMPAVGLPDEGVSKDPFYILNFVSDEDILPPTSPFEVARLAQAFNALVFKEQWRRISVDLAWSLGRCMAVAVPGGEGAGPRLLWQTPDGSSPANYYTRACSHFKQLVGLPPALRERLMAVQYPLLVNGGCSAPHLLLAYGPLALSYREKADADVICPVMDSLNGRVVLPDQWYLVLLPAHSETEGWAYLEATGAAGFDGEVVYDSERPMSDRHPGMVLLDRQAGAVWEIWERLREREWPT
jgi:DEAD/DEAH box helicase domain-containing protein